MKRESDDRLEELEQEKLIRLLIEGYQATQIEDAEINKEWEDITLEKWPH